MATTETSVSDQDWSDADSGAEEEMDLGENTSVVSLFDDSSFPDAPTMFEHCKNVHNFDIVELNRSFPLDFLRFAKFVNLCRRHKMAPTSVAEINKRIDELGDDLLKPVVESDALLWFDIETYLESMKKEEYTSENGKTATQNGDAIDHDISSPSCGNMFSELNARSKESLVHELMDVRAKLQHAQSMLAEAEHQMRLSRELVSRLTTDDEQESQSGSNPPNKEVDEKEEVDPDLSYFESYDSLNIHEEMLQDKVRTESYRDFILNNKAVIEGKRVLDLGCGTGILSLFSASAGAQHVLAVDKSNIVKIARENVQENGFVGRIEVVQGKIESPAISQKLENIDVIISEWMGYFLLFECMLDSVIWTRDYIKTNFGRQVQIYPRFYSMCLCALDDEVLRENNINFWNNVYGFKMTAVRKNIGQNAIIGEVKKEVVCSESFCLQEIDAENVGIGYTNFTSGFQLKVFRKTTVTALCGYFDVDFSKNASYNVTFSTGPHSKLTHWQQVVFVLNKPIDLEEEAVLTGKIGFCRDLTDPRSLKITISTNSETCQYFLK